MVDRYSEILMPSDQIVLLSKFKSINFSDSSRKEFCIRINLKAFRLIFGSILRSKKEIKVLIRSIRLT